MTPMMSAPTTTDEQPMTELEQLTDLCYFLRDLEQEIAPTQQRMTELRAEISELTDRLGRTVVAGFGVVEITAPAKIASYDRTGMEALVRELVADGQHDLAQRIEGLRKESARAGSLRITREKPTATTA